MTYHDFVMNNLEMLLIFSVITGALGAFAAKRKGRDPLFWFFIGALFGMLGVFIAFFLPTQEKKKKLAFAGAQPQENSPRQEPAKISPLLKYEWYFLQEDEKQVGPLSFFNLQQEWHNKTISEKTLVWNSSLEDWKPISEIQDLINCLQHSE